MDEKKIIDQIKKDPAFAQKLRDSYAAAHKKMESSPEWHEFLKELGTNADQLAQINEVRGCGSGATALLSVLEAIREAGDKQK